jgi:hypothetical protein
MRCSTRNQKNAAPADINDENRFTRTGLVSPSGSSGSSRSDHALASSTKSGFPGGCGMPRMCAVAMYSLVSQNAVVGASVMAYSANTIAPTPNAMRYGGSWRGSAARGSGRAGAVRAFGAAWLMKLRAVR